MTGTPEDDPAPTLWDRVEQRIRGYPAGTVVKKVFTPAHWAEGRVLNPIDGVAGRVAWGGILPDRWVLALHEDQDPPCECTYDDFRAAHTTYLSVTPEVFERFELRDQVGVEDKIVDLD